jgi:hypothetical protein
MCPRKGTDPYAEGDVLAPQPAVPHQHREVLRRSRGTVDGCHRDFSIHCR